MLVVRSKGNIAIQANATIFFIASIKADPFFILITSKNFHSIFFLLCRCRIVVAVMCVFKAHTFTLFFSLFFFIWVWTGKSSMSLQSPSDIVDLVDFIFCERQKLCKYDQQHPKILLRFTHTHIYTYGRWLGCRSMFSAQQILNIQVILLFTFNTVKSETIPQH